MSKKKIKNIKKKNTTWSIGHRELKISLFTYNTSPVKKEKLSIGNTRNDSIPFCNSIGTIPNKMEKWASS